MLDTKLKKIEKQILDYIRLHGSVSRQQCQVAMQLSERTANRVLKGWLMQDILNNKAIPQVQST